MQAAKLRPIDIYRSKFASARGFFMEEAIAIWDFLLKTQARYGIEGNFLEIGVLDGKSAGLGGAHLRSDETCVLVDINDISETIRRLDALGVRSIAKVGCRSDNPKLVKSLVEEFEGTVKWFHIDGAHDGYTTLSDLRLADRLLANRGVICVDDFLSPRYPQLTAAVYKFLFDNPTYQMFLCGMNKGYISRTVDFRLYEDAVRDGLAEHMKAAGHAVTLTKTSYSYDRGCFAVLERHNDRDIYGRDEDPSDIPS